MHGRVDRARRDVVAVERDVDVPERDVLVEQVADELVQAGGEMRAAAVDAHEGDGAAAVLLDHLMRDAHERTADVVLVENDLLFGQTVPSWPHGTGLKGLGCVLAGRQDGSASGLTNSGSPRSGNGTSIASKSRGTTVFSKISLASSRTSRGK